jgi:hypothetical protein
MITNLSFLYESQGFETLNEESLLWDENQSDPDAFFHSQSFETELESPPQSFLSTAAQQSDISPLTPPQLFLTPQSVSTSLVLNQEHDLMVRSEGKQRKHNTIKKGEGSDARPDPAGLPERLLFPKIEASRSQTTLKNCDLVVQTYCGTKTTRFV